MEISQSEAERLEETGTVSSIEDMYVYIESVRILSRPGGEFRASTRAKCFCVQISITRRAKCNLITYVGPELN